MPDRYKPMHNDFVETLANIIATVREHDNNHIIMLSYTFDCIKDKIETLDVIARRAFYSFDGSPKAMLVSLSMDTVIDYIKMDIEYIMGDENADINKIFMATQRWFKYYGRLIDISGEILAEFESDKNKNVFDFDAVESRFEEVRLHR